MQQTLYICSGLSAPLALLELLGTPAPSPPERLSKLPKPQFPFGALPKPSHAPDPGGGGLWARGPMRRPRKKKGMSSAFVGRVEPAL